MADAMLQGSCLCKAVRYEISPPFIRFTPLLLHAVP